MAERGSLDALFWKGLLVAAAAWMLYLCLDLVLLAVLAVVLAAAILPVADALQKRRVPRAVTVVGVYAIGLGLLAFVVALLVPAISEQAQLLSQRLPQFYQTLSGWIASARIRLGRFSGGRSVELPPIGLERVGPLIEGVLERSLQATRGLITGAVAGVVVLFVAGYIVVDRRRISEGLLRFVPRGRRERVSRVAADVLRRMGGYIRGQIVVSACAAAILTIGLRIVGFDAPLLIGVLAGVLNFIPYLGSTVSFITAILLALNSPLYTLLGVPVVFGIEQFLEAQLLVPYFTGRQVELHPLAVLGALLVGANLAGALGALVAIPVTAGVDAVLQDVYVRRVSGST